MVENPFVSICIPAYNQVVFLQKTMDSIAQQTYSNFEVVISDDSTTDEVKQLVTRYETKFKIIYHKNTTPLGSPANWNKTLDLAKGDLIKFMHHDDWFASATSLAEFVNAFAIHKDAAFAFCDTEILNVAENTISYNVPPAGFLERLKKDPKTLFNENRIGAPTAVMYKKSELRFDEKIKFVVDVDFYIRFLSKHSFVYINKPLIVNTSHHAGQVTAASMNKETLVGEYSYLYNKVYKGKIPGKELSLFFIRYFRAFKMKRLSEINVFGEQPHPKWFFKILVLLAQIKR